MGRRSTIKSLTPELRRELDRLLIEDRLTQAQVAEHMRKLGAQVSESAVYRYEAKMRDLVRDIRLTREMSAVIGRELESLPDHDTGRMLVESLQTLLFKAQMQLRSGDDVDEKQLARFASTARDLASALKMHTDTEAKVRDRILRKAAEVAGGACKKLGYGAEVANLIREQIMGISQESLSRPAPQPESEQQP